MYRYDDKVLKTTCDTRMIVRRRVSLYGGAGGRVWGPTTWGTSFTTYFQKEGPGGSGVEGEPEVG